MIRFRKLVLKAAVLFLLFGVVAVPSVPVPWAPGPTALGAEPSVRLRVRVSWGHRAPNAGIRFLRLRAFEAEISPPEPRDMEPEEGLVDGLVDGPEGALEDGFVSGAWRTRAGGGDVDGIEFTLAFPAREPEVLAVPHAIWSYLLEHGDPEAAGRLRRDPGFRRDGRRLTFEMAPDGTRGFSLTVDQLLSEGRFWIPGLDVFISTGDAPVSFEEHMRALEPWVGTRILDRVRSEPEASLERFAALWEDMGSPGYKNPSQVGPGHIVGLAWDSSIPKFGIDRGAGVWNDYGNPDVFRFTFDFGDLSRDLTRSWKGQRLERGLPVITTSFEDAGVRYEVEQFAYPSKGPPAERRGDIAMVLFQRLRVTELEGRARTLTLGMTHERKSKAGIDAAWTRERDMDLLEEATSRRILLAIRGEGFECALRAKAGAEPVSVSIAATLALEARGTREGFVLLPSPPVDLGDRETFLGLDPSSAREATLRFWSERLEEGAHFEVPEETVNDLYRANLWHALRLPRRHGGNEAGIAIDFPYSNFAYDQTGAPWPINQAVYVDTMLHDQRGHHSVSAEELAALYRRNQESDGRVKGFANWGVYTPGMIYSVALHFLLSGDRGSFEGLLPQTLKALDWCLGEVARSPGDTEPHSGLILAPLNDLSHETRAWAFNQAYVSAALKRLGQALSRIEHPRAAECLEAARRFDRAIERGFGRAATRSPLVQLRDRTWCPYVPSDAMASGRLFEVWYPTDVDTGALHLSRLKALDPEGFLTSCLLDDHEDNLFFRGLGMANEPVYDQQATVYLLRDEPKAAIRSFYSMMACAFSHSALEPVEHRWGWGQYFGPPSTDGAWFDLYRRMLIHERDDGSLLLLQATPRAWLEDGKRIRIKRAPTWYGKLALSVESRAAAGEIRATVDLEDRVRPASILLRLRHPQGRSPRSVTVDGEAWTDFDTAKEWVRLERPKPGSHAVTAKY